MTNSTDDDKSKLVKLIPSLQFYQQTYAGSFENNDQKALQAFVMFEAREKIKRLQGELLWLKDGKVDEAVCNAILGKKRFTRYESKEKWAEYMLIWLSTALKRS